MTPTLNVTTPLAHSTVLAYKGTWEMACIVLVRKFSVIILLELNTLVHALNCEWVGCICIEFARFLFTERNTYPNQGLECEPDVCSLGLYYSNVCFLTSMLVFSQTKMNVKMEHITVT